MQKSVIDSEDTMANSLKRVNFDNLFKEWLLMLSLAGNETRHVVTPNSPDITELFSLKWCGHE
jgi:phage baseplate assembly protein gpV